MATGFDAQNEAHLEELLRRVEQNLAEGSPIGLRTAAMYILDYYQSILKEAASKVGVNLEGTAIPVRISRVRSSIGGLKINSLEGLEDIRTSIYHDENRLPSEKALRKYLNDSRSTRDLLLKAAATAVAKEKVMTRTAQRLRAGGEELLRLVPSLNSELLKRAWKTRAERAIHIAEENPEGVGEDGLELLLQIHEQIATIRTREEVFRSIESEGYEPEPDDDYFRSQEEYAEPEYDEPDFDPRDFYPKGAGDEEGPDEEPPEDDRPRDDQPPEDEPPEDEAE